MARINTNVASLIAQTGLARSQSEEQTTLQRLSTGLRINSGADDPAGLIASESLKSEIAGLQQAISNSSQATNVISTADAALSQVSSLLINIKGLIVGAANSGGLSQAEIQADQLQVDSAIQSITRIANTTNFAGLNLLNGSLDYVTSGIHPSAIASVNVSQANLGTNASIPVNVNVISSAKLADLQFRTSSIAVTTTLNIAGNTGTQSLTFVSGTTASAIAFSVNSISDTTGVKATLINGANALSGINFVSTGYGSKNFVSVEAQSGAFATTDTAGAATQRVVGADAIATVNGALTVGDGLDIQVNTSTLDLNLTLNSAFPTGATSFEITGGGALFQLGSQVASDQQVSVGVGSVAASALGNSNVGFLNQVQTGGVATLIGGKTEAASAIIEAAIQQVAIMQGRLGAFETNTLQTNASSLQIALENVTSSESNIADANFATETSNLTREQILSQAGTSVLATANSQSQNVLTLLQGH